MIEEPRDGLPLLVLILAMIVFWSIMWSYWPKAVIVYVLATVGVLLLFVFVIWIKSLNERIRP